MRATASLLKACLSFLVASSMSACMSTKAVLDAGKRVELLQGPHAIIMAEDGSLAAEVKAVYTKDRGGIVCERKKYLIASRPVIEATIQQAASADYTRQLRYHLRLPANTVYLPELPYCADLEYSWQLVPDDFGGPDATVDYLPTKFREHSTTFKPNEKQETIHVKYFSDGKSYELQFNFNAEYFRVYKNLDLPRRKRVWWGYPVQILVVPAFLTDLLASPLWLALIGENHEYIHYKPPWEAF